MALKIGISTKAFPHQKWYKHCQDCPFDTIEINRRVSFMQLNPYFVKSKKILSFLEGKDLSMHSGTSKIFIEPEQFTRAEIEMFKAEVLICGIFGINELIVHLRYNSSEEQKKILRELFDYAKEHGVEPIYESNESAKGEKTLKVLEDFPDIGYNFDMGHVYRGLYNKTLGMELDEFIEKVKDRVVYIHAHNNDGTKDQHNALDNGTLDWKHVLDLLDLSKVKKIIFEVLNMDEALHSKKLLEEYLASKA